VDLAGSEKASIHYQGNNNNPTSLNPDSISGSNAPIAPRTSSVKERINEGKHINKSLFFLSQVIAMKAEGKKYANQLKTF
jgi:hypothetical protein